MDKKSQARFDAIVGKDPSGVTPADLIFLKAREYYLTDAQKDIYFNHKSKQVVPEVKKDSALARFRELKKRAIAEGIVVTKGIKLAELEELLA